MLSLIRKCAYIMLVLVIAGFSSLLFAGQADSTQNTDTSGVGLDGPYIFYDNGRIISKQILSSSGQFSAQTDTFSAGDNQVFTCNLPGQQGFQFTLAKDIPVQESVYPMPEKMIAISDIEGNYVPFREFLINNGVIDSDNKWIFGKGHLVIPGDVFDRGLNVTECLWFIYYLEQEATKSGGHVHFILGNHEIMNMNGNIKYVRKKYIDNAAMLGEDYRNFYKPSTELGRWLESKNITEKIGDYLFLHGGISKEINEQNASIETINRSAREYYYRSKEAKLSNDTLVKLLYNSKLCPFWYRGYVDQTIVETDLDNTLNIFVVNKIVVGHTIVDDVRYFYNKKVIGIDTDHAEGDTEGLLIENGVEYRVDISGARTPIN